MAKIHRYRAHGLTIESSLELPVPEFDGNDPTDVVLNRALDDRWRAVVQAAFHSRPDSETEPFVFDHWTPDGLVIEFVGAALICASESAVSLVGQSTDDDDIIAHLLLDHVLPRVVSLRGDLMLHGAGAVGPSGFAHVILGRSGIGKSTLSAAMAASGWPLLDDDGVRVGHHEDRFFATPGYSGLRLLPDAASAVIPGIAPGRPMSRGHQKRRFTMDGSQLNMATGSAPIGGVYLLQRSLTEVSTVEALSLGEAMLAVVEHGFHVTADFRELNRHAFERASELVAAVPAWRLSTPHGLSNLADTLTLFHALDASMNQVY